MQTILKSNKLDFDFKASKHFFFFIKYIQSNLVHVHLIGAALVSFLFLNLVINAYELRLISQSLITIK